MYNYSKKNFAFVSKLPPKKSAQPIQSQLAVAMILNFLILTLFFINEL